MTQHKWHKEIKAWSDGAEIEGQWQWAQKGSPTSGWRDIKSPDWESEAWIYRIKPQPKDTQYLYVYQTLNGIELGYPRHPTQIKNHTGKFTCIGKIKLEDDDE